MKRAVILVNIRSVHTVGSIFRTAVAAGFEKIYCCGITPSPLDRFKNIRADFAKVALGAEQAVAWEAGVAATDIVAELRRTGWKVFAVEQAANSAAYNHVRDTLRAVDAILEIPMHGSKESLNVAVAFGIVAFELARGSDRKK